MVRAFLSFILILPLLGITAQEVHYPNSAGAYKTFEEFVQDRPGITEPLKFDKKERKQKNWEGTYSLKPRYVVNNKKVKRIWGFHDGVKAYVYHEGDYFPIEADKNSYYFYGYDEVDNSGAAGAAAMGGAIGGGIYGAAAASAARKEKIRYTLDPATGEIIHPRSNLSADNKNTLIIYRINDNDRNAYYVSLEDSVKFKILPNGYLHHTFMPKRSNVKLCYGKELEKCDIIDMFENASVQNELYMEYRIGDSGNNIDLLKVIPSVGQDESLRPRSVQLRRGKLEAIEIKE
jgi:hypothetical protein